MSSRICGKEHNTSKRRVVSVEIRRRRAFRSHTHTYFAFISTHFYIATAISCDGFLDQKGTGDSARLAGFPSVLASKRLSPFIEQLLFINPQFRSYTFVLMISRRLEGFNFLTMRRVTVHSQLIRFVRLDSEHAQMDG